MKALHIPQLIVDAVVAHAQAAYPHECCGFLAGHEDHVIVELPLENAADTPETRFESSAQSTLAAYREMQRRGLEPLAVYHSHPTSSAVPSATDRARHDMPGAACVIISLLNELPTMRAWRMGDTVEEIPIIS